MAICELGFMVSSFAAPRPCHDGQIPLGRGAVPRGVRIGKYLAVSTLQQSTPVSKRAEDPPALHILVMRLHSTLLYAISAELHRLSCGARTEADYRTYKRVKQSCSDRVDITAISRQSVALSREERPPTKHSRALFIKHTSQISVEDGSTRATCTSSYTQILGST